MVYVTQVGEARLREAIEAIEGASSVEVVVTVRPRLRRWLVPNLAVAALFLAAALAFALYSDVEFDLWAILSMPLAAAAVGGMLVDLVAPLERALVPRRIADELLVTTARAAFVELGVHGTRGRTGLLALVAVRERRAALIGDAAVVERFGEDALARCAEQLAACIPRGAEAIAAGLAELAPAFGEALPRAADDINELPDAIHARRIPRRFRARAE